MIFSSIVRVLLTKDPTSVSDGKTVSINIRLLSQKGG